MISPARLNGAEVDALRRLARMGGADAVRALARFLGASVEGTTPRAHVALRAHVERILSGPTGDSFAAWFTIEGGARLRQLIHFTPDGCTLMAGLLLGTPLDARSSEYKSSLAEACNIIVSSYCGGLSAALGATLVPSVPHVLVGPLEAAIRTAFGEADESLLLVTDLRLPGVRFAGRIITAPEPDSLETLLAQAGPH